ncbi:sulfatase [Lewinella sp. LCG006]|uniref:sulfatase family protein n=1 Tax=Lewinella sp. LCG006 TaxID=3231911 RepID=UPI00345F53EF
MYSSPFRRLFNLCLYLVSLSLTTLHAQPNIVWIVCEDISPTLAIYGDSTAQTPNIDALAAESIIYDHAFAPVGVCAPSRSGIITGMEPTHIGTMHMRTGKDISAWGRRTYEDRIPAVDIAGDSLREYAAVPPSAVKCFTEYLRTAGYYCTNNAKTDYQFAAPLTAWDENGNQAHWRNRAPAQPFFAVFNTNLTHESKLWAHADKPLTVDPATVPVPPYLPDTEEMRKTLARHYSNVELMDAFVGKLVAELKADGLYEETIIFFYSDHGGPLPRQKREIYDTGLRIPFLVKPSGSTSSSRSEQLISLVDLAPTLLSLAGIVPPDHLDGRAFMGQYTQEARIYVYGNGDRFDEHSDRSRTIRDERYRYVWNFYPEKPRYKDIAYRKQIPALVEMLNLDEQGKLPAEQHDWFVSKPVEELYDCERDPHQLNNLATNPAYVQERSRMREALYEHLSTHPDLGFLPEAQLIDLMWPGGQQPQTMRPTYEERNGIIALHCTTPGASIAYVLVAEGEKMPSFDVAWELYQEPLKVPSGKRIYVLAERLGYQTSEVLELPQSK